MVSKEELYDLYWNQELSGYQVAEKFGFTPQWTYYWLKKYGIPVRGQKPKHGEETKKQISKSLEKTSATRGKKISLALQGRHMSKEWRQKISRALKGRVPWSKGKKLLAEHKRKIAEANKGKCLSEETRDKIRKARLKRVFPTKDTSIERKLQNELRKQGITQFETHKNVLDLCQPDIVFTKEKIAVECDGDYWHGNPRFFDLDKLNPIQKRMKMQDLKQNVILRENGWIVLHFWENEIIHNVEFCVDEIKNALKEVMRE